MSIRRVAVIYNGTDRPETTGVYVRRALGELVEVEHVEPGDWHRLDGVSFDLYLQVDDGHDVVLPPSWRPAAFWAIDTHMNLDRYLRVAKHYDLIFTAQREGAEALQLAGIPALWLPLACDPFFHRPHSVAKQHDICFIGNLVEGPRTDLVYFLQQQFQSMLIARRYFAEMAEAYSASKVVFNRSIKYDINMRVFEGVACGSLLLTNDLTAQGQSELFQDGVHLATYRHADELLDKLQFYLRNDAIRQKVEQCGAQHAHDKHTYRHRVETILQAAEHRASKVQVAVSKPNPAPSPGNFTSDPYYFGYVRQEILDLVPTTAKRILDIGCGAGRLGQVLQERQAATVIGVEATPAAAALARQRLDGLYEGDIESLSLDQEQPFDAIICADVLEHLQRPLEVLRRARHWLQPQGTLIVSLPNVRHHSVVRGLLQGHWMYEPAGLLDETHLRFFTRREIEKLLYRAGFTIEQSHFTTGAEHAEWIRQGRPGEVRLGSLCVSGMTPQEAEEFHVYQFLYTAKPRHAKCYGKTSIIIVTHNGLADTRDCVSSLLQLTDEAVELIFVDNGSTDGTPEYLESLQAAHVIRNPENRGFPAAVNQGLQRATGEQILLLNNDTYLTTGWLIRLLDALYAEENIGLVGPMSNCAPGAQRVRDVPYTGDYMGLDGFAWDLAAKFAKQRTEVGTLSGFCLLLRKAVYDQLGLLDERFGIGTMEDDDYCHRARMQGWKIVVAQDVYLHHTGHQTFRSVGMDFDALAEKNRQVYEKKWQPATATPTWGLTSIIIPVHGQLSHTQRCVDSIRRHTPEPFELIVIDNASPDETSEWLRTQTDVTVIANPQNRGFPAAVNQGLRMAQGHHLLVLNNDTVVTSGWLARLLEALHADQAVGIVGPCTNRISGEQQIAVTYHQESLQGLDAFAHEWSLQHRQQREVTDRLVGFCMLLKRTVLEKIGGFDEQFGLGNFEDDDLCHRAMQAGFQLLIARDAFIHHVGHATFKGAGIPFGDLLQRNQALFEKKWAHTTLPSTDSAPIPVVEYQLAETGNAGSRLLTRKHIRLSLCMIVRNNAKFIVECLRSIRPYVDEMIIVDTGSTDNTAELARSLGARVYHFPWCDSFSAARNESLRYAQGHWIFWMDSDDVISPECGAKLRDLAYQDHPEQCLGFMVQVHCLGSGSEGHHDIVAVDHVKLIRNLPEIRFELRMHEQIIQSIRRKGGQIEWTDIFVTHANYDHTPDGQKLKLERDLKLLHLDDAENPDHPFVLFNLGMTYAGHDPVKAIGYLERSIQKATPGESHLRKCFAFLVQAYLKNHQNDEALKAIERGLQQFPLDPELRYWKAGLFTDLGRPLEAIAQYRDLLQNKPERHITSVMQGMETYLARTQLAQLRLSQGHFEEATKEYQQVTQEFPWFRPAWRGLIDTMLQQGRVQAAADLIHASQALRELPGEGEHLLGLVHLAIQDVEQAVRFLHQATVLHPEDVGMVEKIAFVTFTHITSQHPMPYLERLLELDPNNPSAYHNMATLQLQAHQLEAAERSCRRSIELRPHSKQTYELLASILRASGDLPGADAALRQAL